MALCQLKNMHYHTLFPSQVMVLLFRQFIYNHPLKQWLAGKKKGEMQIQKLEYLKTKNSFLGEIKAFFIITEGLSFGESINQQMPADLCSNISTVTPDLALIASIFMLQTRKSTNLLSR